MTESITVTRFWGGYPLEVVVADVGEHFVVGPFAGTASPTKARGPRTVTLRWVVAPTDTLGETAPVAAIDVPTEGAVTFSREGVTFRVARGPRVPRLPRRFAPEPRMVMAGAFAVVVVALLLAWAATSLPALGRLSVLLPGLGPSRASPVLIAPPHRDVARPTGQPPTYSLEREDAGASGTGPSAS